VRPPPLAKGAMIVLHRLTHPDQPFHVNPDLIQTVEATPDTVVSLENTAKFVVIESPDEILDLIRDWRAAIITQAMRQNAAPQELV
jgi:flagellar protein FlbD